MSFLLGYICGIATLAVFARHLSRTQSKPEAAQHGAAAISMPLHTHRQAESIFHLPKGTA